MPRFDSDSGALKGTLLPYLIFFCEIYTNLQNVLHCGLCTWDHLSIQLYTGIIYTPDKLIHDVNFLASAEIARVEQGRERGSNLRTAGVHVKYAILTECT
jgi:hypothetical protein